MTAQIPLSQIGDAAAFKARVEAFREAKLDHHGTVGEPAPRAHELVEAAVRRVPRGDAADDYAIDYEIVDDRPSLRARKDALIHQVTAQEQALMVASLPPGKRRLAALRAHDIHQKPEAERSDTDKQFLAAEAARHAREQAIGRHAAQLMHDIEDLTEATIGAWAPTPFPNQESAIRNQGSEAQS